METLAEKLKNLMGWNLSDRSRRLSLREVARGTGLSHSYLWMLVSGARDNPTADVLERLSHYFGTDISYFHETRGPGSEGAQFRGRLVEVRALIHRAETDGPEELGPELEEAWELVCRAGPAELAVRVALAYCRCLRSQKAYPKGEAVLRQLSGRWLGKLPLDYEIRVQFQFAVLAYEQARYFEAVERMETCLERIESAGHQTPLLEDVWYNLGIYYRRVGRPEDSVRAYLRARELHPDDSGQRLAFIHMGLGQAYRDCRRYEESLEHLLGALEILTELGDAKWAGAVCNNLGDTLCELGRWREARARYEAGLLAHRMVRYERGAGLNLAGIARCQLELGDPAKALSTVNQALSLLAQLGEKPDWADALLVRARVYTALEEWDKARADLEKAKTCFHEGRMVPHLLRAIAVEAELDSRMGALEDGAERLRRSAEVVRGLADWVRTVGRAA